MNIGPYTLHAIEAGRFGLDGGAMFGIIPRPLWERRIEPDASGRIPLATRCLLLVSDERRILIDTGIGDKFDAKHNKIYSYDPSEPGLLDGLAKAGVGPGDITDVILTHLHFDHCGGNTRWDGERATPIFPNAVHHVQEEHLTWARSGNPREQASFMEENFAPLEANGQLSLVAGERELFDGVHVARVNGHTDAQQIVRIEGAGDTLVFVADLIPTAHHLAPVWGMGYDIRPLVTIEEKSAFLDQAMEKGWRLFFEHDAHTETGRVERDERGRATLADAAPLSAL